MNSWISLSIAVLVWIGLAGEAHASQSVAVLGVRSLDGEDELERRVTHGLRTGMAELPDYAVSDRIVSLDQMTLAHGCDEPSDTCLAQIAETLGVELLIFGSVVAKDAGHDLALQAFDARVGRSTSTTARTLSAAQLTPAGVAETLPTLLRQLLGLPVIGRLHLTSNRPGAALFVDHAAHGVLDERGETTIELPVGKHLVRITEPAHDEVAPPAFEERTVDIKLGSTAELQVAMPDAHAAVPAPVAPPAKTSSRRSLKRVFGWVSVGFGAALAAATVYSWVRIERINDDPDYLAYRKKFPRGDAANGSSDVCRSASQGVLAAREPESAALERTAKDLCDEADTLEILQYVFVGGAVAAGGTGTYLLLTAPPRGSEPRASLRPRFDASRALLEASFKF